MPAYLIAFRDGPEGDPAEIAQYHDKARHVPPHGMQPRIIYGAVHALEGEAPETMAMIEFPDVEAARAWYFSPEYQAAIPHRQRAAAWRMMIVEGI